jgi:hypothetical protein
MSSEFPIPSLRQSLLPDQLVRVRTFMANNIEELDGQINNWITDTKALIVIPGPVSLLAPNSVSISLTYVAAKEGERHG